LRVVSTRLWPFSPNELAGKWQPDEGLMAGTCEAEPFHDVYLTHQTSPNFRTAPARSCLACNRSIPEWPKSSGRKVHITTKRVTLPYPLPKHVTTDAGGKFLSLSGALAQSPYPRFSEDLFPRVLIVQLWLFPSLRPQQVHILGPQFVKAV
jgi:hypothetical protein